MNTFLFVHRRQGVKGKVVEDTTFSGYVDKCKIIERYLGEEKIADLTLEDLINFVKQIQTDGYSESTVKQTRDLITSFMRFAKKDKVTEVNVLADEKITISESKKAKEKYILEKNDYEKFINYCKGNEYADLIFMLCTGVRISELAGILWEDIKWDKMVVDINKEYTRIKKVELEDGKRKTKAVCDFKELKSKDSYRIIGIECMMDILKNHKEKQKELAKKNNREFTEKDFVFTTNKYNAVKHDGIWDKVKKVMIETKVKNYKDISTHNLRHSFCTNGLSDGVKLEEMKKLMGHSNISTTMLYTHVQEEQVIRASTKAVSSATKYL